MIGFGFWYVVHYLSYLCQDSSVLFNQQFDLSLTQSRLLSFNENTSYLCKLIEMNTSLSPLLGI